MEESRSANTLQARCCHSFHLPALCIHGSVALSAWLSGLPQCSSCQETHQHQQANGGQEATTAHHAGQTGHGHLGSMGQARHGEEGSQEVQSACTGARSNMYCTGARSKNCIAQGRAAVARFPMTQPPDSTRAGLSALLVPSSLWSHMKERLQQFLHAHVPPQASWFLEWNLDRQQTAVSHQGAPTAQPTALPGTIMRPQPVLVATSSASPRPPRSLSAHNLFHTHLRWHR